ncbi:MAG TPA: MFS transporter [Cytophagaceae bacterium]|nr:MFS transporter [Cytophagaceae bacterium]
MEKNNKKIVNAWCIYDWANSVYSLTITTAVFPIYFAAVTSKASTETNASGQHLIDFLGVKLPNSSLYSYSLSFAFLAIALINPLLSGMADYSGKKKSFMQFFAYMGACSCALLYFFDAHAIWVGILFFIIATIGYAGSLVFYNAYLPEIATSDQFDRVSAKGFSMGYIGSVLLLIINIIMLQTFADSGEAARLSFLSVGIWWALFAAYTFMHLPKGDRSVKEQNGESYFVKGYKEVSKVFSEIKMEKKIRNFLLAFFFYNMSFQTIMYLASIFGSEELKIPETGLILTILIIQLVAIAGATLFALTSKKFGNIVTLLLALSLCIVVCVAAYFVASANQFYFLAVLVGLIMGGIQSLSRSTYSKLLPETKDHASYFSFYELTDKIGTALGTAVYGTIATLTGNMRNSIFALVVFFIIGILFLNVLRKMNVFNKN